MLYRKKPKSKNLIRLHLPWQEWIWLPSPFWWQPVMRPWWVQCLKGRWAPCGQWSLGAPQWTGRRGWLAPVSAWLSKPSCASLRWSYPRWAEWRGSDPPAGSGRRSPASQETRAPSGNRTAITIWVQLEDAFIHFNLINGMLQRKNKRTHIIFFCQLLRALRVLQCLGSTEMDFGTPEPVQYLGSNPRTPILLLHPYDLIIFSTKSTAVSITSKTTFNNDQPRTQRKGKGPLVRDKITKFSKNLQIYSEFLQISPKFRYSS